MGEKGRTRGHLQETALMKVKRCQMSRRDSFLSGKEKLRIKTPQSGIVPTSQMNDENRKKVCSESLKPSCRVLGGGGTFYLCFQEFV